MTFRKTVADGRPHTLTSWHLSMSWSHDMSRQVREVFVERRFSEVDDLVRPRAGQMSAGSYSARPDHAASLIDRRRSVFSDEIGTGASGGAAFERRQAVPVGRRLAGGRCGGKNALTVSEASAAD